jgi:hypothetical protein
MPDPAEFRATTDERIEIINGRRAEKHRVALGDAEFVFPKRADVRLSEDALRATRLDIADWREATRQIERLGDKYRAIHDAKVNRASGRLVEGQSRWTHWAPSH